MPELENSFPEQPENITPPAAETSFFAKLKPKWPIVFGVLGSIALFSAIIYAAYSYGKRGQEVQPTPTVAPTPTSVVAVTPLLTTSLTPTVSSAAKVSSEGKIAFVRDGDIWVISPDGSEDERITNLSTEKAFVALDNQIKWSSDGTRVLFQKQLREGKLALMSYEIESAVLSELIPGGIVKSRAPTIDAIYDFFQQVKEEQAGMCYTTEISGQFDDRFRVYGHSYCIGEQATISASNRVELNSQGKIIRENIFSGALYILEDKSDSDTIIQTDFAGADKKVVIEESDITAFDLSPDGTKIAYITQSSSSLVSNLYELVLFDVTNNSKRKVFEGMNLSSPIWSPDGQKILYSFSEGDTTTLGYSDLTINKQIVLDDSKLIEFFGLKQAAAVGYASYDWSSNSQQIVAGVNILTLDTPTGEKKGLIVFDLANGTLKLLITNASQPAWSPR